MGDTGSDETFDFGYHTGLQSFVQADMDVVVKCFFFNGDSEGEWTVGRIRVSRRRYMSQGRGYLDSAHEPARIGLIYGCSPSWVDSCESGIEFG